MISDLSVMLKFTPSKMEILLVGLNLYLGSGWLFSDAEQSGTPSERPRYDLGVLLAPALLVDKQGSAIAKRVFYPFWLVCQL